MSQPVTHADDETRRRALTLLETFMARAQAGELSGGLGSPEFTGLLAELRSLDPALQKRIAQAMVTSRGDPAALRAAIEVDGADDSPKARPSAPRPPTVVDARGDTSWKAIALALLAVAVVAALIAGGQ